MITRRAKQNGKSTAEAMAENSQTARITCPKFEIKGQIQFRKWIQFFKRKCENFEESEKLQLFQNFLAPEATTFFINNCQDITDWNDLKKIFIEHFDIPEKTTFEDFINMKLRTD